MTSAKLGAGFRKSVVYRKEKERAKANKRSAFAKDKIFRMLRAERKQNSAG